MKKEPHITEFSAKRGDGLHVRVTTSRNGRRIAIDGGRLYYSEYPTKSACMRAARAVRDDILRDIQINPANHVPTVAELFQRSFEFLPIAASTRRNYQHMFDSFIPCHDKPIAAVTLADIQLSVNDYAANHSAERLPKFIALWKRIYKTAFYLQTPVVDYSAMITRPKSKHVTKKQNRDLTYETFLNALDLFAASNSYYAPIATNVAWVMYYTGMRITEVLALMPNDIDMQGGFIHVRRNIGANGTEMTAIVPLKTSKSLRNIPIADGLVPVLGQLLDTAGDMLFMNHDGRLLSPSVLTTWVNTICGRHGVPFSLYRLRHLFSADLFRDGINPKVIQSLMGHKSENMSLYYAFATDAERKNAVNKRKPS